MNKFAILGIILTVVSACVASPIKHRWSLTPDGEGNMHLVDVDPDTIDVEPLFNAETDTAFLLFTRSNPTVPQRITWTADSIQNSNFNPAHPTRFTIHGWNSGPASGANTAPTASYLQLGNFNVIGVDWSIGAGTVNYVLARNRVPQVADVLARFINFLISNGSTAPNRINIAGHSLGAHISGLTGKRVPGINTLFALDPARPLFSIDSPNDRFAENDAVYTEGIHTNAGNLGFDVPLAHATFYPNWGSSQPGCANDNCSHSRAHALFAESIVSDRFVSRRCNSYQEIVNRNCNGSGTASMGGDPGNVGLRGIFFLETNGISPFARG